MMRKLLLVLCLSAPAFGQTLTLPFYEGFEPVGGDPGNCQQSDRGAWNFQLEWQACRLCGDDAVLADCTGQNESRCWGPQKFESWPDRCAGGQVYSGYRAGRQPIFDPFWAAILHPFTPPTGLGDLHVQVMQYDPDTVACPCECNCDNDPIFLPIYPNGRPNYQIQGWVCLRSPNRDYRNPDQPAGEAFALGINSYSSWMYYSWFTMTDGWHRTIVPRTRGWHQLEILVHPYRGMVGDVEFKIDGVTVGQGRRATWGGLPIAVNGLTLGGDPALLAENTVANTFEELWYDDVMLEFLPVSCLPPRFDLNRDGFVDMSDFAAFQLCYTGADTAAYNALDCHCLDTRGADENDFTPNRLIDWADLAAMLACFSGPGVVPDPGCGN